MNWTKKGLIYRPNREFAWMQDRAIAPVCELLSDDRLRIYFSSRDLQGRSTPIYLDTNPEYPEQIISVSGDPILEFGRLGSFDDNGILSSSIVCDGNRRYLYYVGWNPRVTVSYHLSIGLAISENNAPFQKVSEGPILDRSSQEPFFNTAPFVLKDSDGVWKMWYVSCTGWKVINGSPEPLYNIKYATAPDGINWTRTGRAAIENDAFAEAIGKPFIYREAGAYRMIYSYRNSINYRTDPQNSYRLGYAESGDGVSWTRMDEKLNFSLSSEGWDSVMQEYATTYVFKGKRYLIYNGNGFGETGFGYAVQEQA